MLAAQAKRARETKKLTQATAATKLHISAASLAAYEQGTRDIPDAMVDAMAEIYGVHPAIFRYGADVLKIAASHETARQLREVAGRLASLADTLQPQPDSDITDRADDPYITPTAPPADASKAGRMQQPPKRANG